MTDTKRVALVTGSASGIGEAIALAYAKQGMIIVVCDIDKNAGEKIAQQCRQLSDNESCFMPLDVRDQQQWQEVIKQVSEQYNRLDILVNNAGVGGVENFEELSLSGWQRVMDINLNSVFLGCQTALSLLKKSSDASIVNISSVHGTKVHPQSIPYSASKAAVLSMTESVALYCTQNNYAIRVNAIQPGYIQTPMLQQALEQAPDAQAMQQGLEQLHPIGRLGQCQDIANAALFLVSEQASFMTGASLVVDGGFTIA